MSGIGQDKEKVDILMQIDEIIENFELMDDWEDRYRYVIELGRELEPLQPEDYSEEHKVRGCASQVWLVTEREGEPDRPMLKFRGDSDAHIVRGLIAILIALYSGKRADEIADMDAEPLFDQLGLRDHLTPQRSNGLASMVKRVREDAASATGAATA
jgi:cysteine desulfuration protein SufE